MSTIRNVWTAVKGYFEEFKILKTVPAEFWNLNLIVNFFEMLAYFCFITIITLYLTNNLGISDSATGDIVGVFTLLISVIVFISGPIIDTIGVKKALVISMAILIPTRLFLGSTNFIEEKYIAAKANTPEVIEAIKKGEYHIKSFTKQEKKFTAAQADIYLYYNKQFPNDDLNEAIKDEPEILKFGTALGIMNDPQLRPKWEADLDSKMLEALDMNLFKKRLKIYYTKTGLWEKFTSNFKSEEAVKETAAAKTAAIKAETEEEIVETIISSGEYGYPFLDKKLFDAAIAGLKEKKASDKYVVASVVDEKIAQLEDYVKKAQTNEKAQYDISAAYNKIFKAHMREAFEAGPSNKDAYEAWRKSLKQYAEMLEKSGEFFFKLDRAFKNPELYKEAVKDIVLSKKELKEKYIYDFDALQGDKLNEGLAATIMAFKSLREKYSINTALHPIVFITLILLALGEGLMVPAIYIALRRFTNKRTSGTGFNFQYLSMNIAAIMSGLTIDSMRGYFGTLAGNEAILLFGAGCAVICTIAALKLRTNIEVKDDGEVVEHESDSYGEKGENPVGIMLSVMKEKAFWRFMLFLVLLVGVKLVFTHQFLVMPKYYERVLGDYAQIGILNAINPMIIVIGLILFIPILGRFNIFKLIIVGTFFSAISVFFLVIPGKMVGDAMGTSIEIGYLSIILAQIIVFAVGEVIWSPRLSEYTVTIAPKGKEGTYMSLAVLPMFVAKPLNGAISGRLLESYCPEGVMEGIQSGVRTFWNGPEFMWLVLGIISISSPILVLLLRNFVESKRSDEPEPAAESKE